MGKWKNYETCSVPSISFSAVESDRLLRGLLSNTPRVALALLAWVLRTFFSWVMARSYAINIKKCASLSKSGYPACHSKIVESWPKKRSCRASFLEIFFVGLIFLYLFITRSFYMFLAFHVSQKKVSALLHNFLIVLLVLLLFRFSLNGWGSSWEIFGANNSRGWTWTNWVSWLSPNSMGISGS